MSVVAAGGKPGPCPDSGEGGDGSAVSHLEAVGNFGRDATVGSVSPAEPTPSTQSSVSRESLDACGSDIGETWWPPASSQLESSPHGRELPQQQQQQQLQQQQQQLQQQQQQLQRRPQPSAVTPSSPLTNGRSLVSTLSPRPPTSSHGMRFSASLPQDGCRSGSPLSSPVVGYTLPPLSPPHFSRGVVALSLSSPTQASRAGTTAWSPPLASVSRNVLVAVHPVRAARSALGAPTSPQGPRPGTPSPTPPRLGGR
jgi:hypothetical protein